MRPGLHIYNCPVSVCVMSLYVRKEFVTQGVGRKEVGRKVGREKEIRRGGIKGQEGRREEEMGEGGRVIKRGGRKEGVGRNGGRAGGRMLIVCSWEIVVIHVWVGSLVRCW